MNLPNLNLQAMPSPVAASNDLLRELISGQKRTNLLLEKLAEQIATAAIADRAVK